MDELRLLHRIAGYTDEPTQAMPREPEAVDEETQRDISADARRRFETEHAYELLLRQDKSSANRLINCQNESRRLGLEVERFRQRRDALLAEWERLNAHSRRAVA